MNKKGQINKLATTSESFNEGHFILMCLHKNTMKRNDRKNALAEKTKNTTRRNKYSRKKLKRYQDRFKKSKRNWTFQNKEKNPA